MFDPSKLDLEINDDNKKTSKEDNSSEALSHAEKNQETIKITEEKTPEETQEIVLEQENQSNSDIDPLSNISLENETKTSQEVDDILITLPPQEAKNENKEYGVDNEHNYDKSDVLAQVQEEEIQKIKEEEKIVFDINIAKVEDVLIPLQENEYDFATIEPSEDFVKIIYRKDKVIVLEKNIKYPIYSQLLLKIKSA
jgi:hypothetical protein